MNAAQIAQVQAIATATRTRLLTEDPDWVSQGECQLVSCLLIENLAAAGIIAHLASGFFKLDWPDPEMSDGVGPGIDVSLPVHFWVELDGFVLDASADQYDDEVEGGIPSVLLLPVAQAWRHHRTKIDPVIDFYETGPWHCPNHAIASLDNPPRSSSA